MKTVQETLGALLDLPGAKSDVEALLDAALGVAREIPGELDDRAITLLSRVIAGHDPEPGEADGMSGHLLDAGRALARLFARPLYHEADATNADREATS